MKFRSRCTCCNWKSEGSIEEVSKDSLDHEFECNEATIITEIVIEEK